MLKSYFHRVFGDLTGENGTSPYGAVSFYSGEDVSTNGLRERMYRDFIRNNLAKYYNISVDEYLHRTYSECQLMVKIATGLIKEDLALATEAKNKEEQIKREIDRLNN